MFKKRSFRCSLLQIIVLTSAVRCWMALALNLGNDEVYYFTYAVQPDWNHFDHPPLVGLFIRLFTLNLHWVNDLSMRLPAIAGAAVNTWLIARCGKKIRNKNTGLIAAILYNTSIYTSIISGLFILPDSVQVVFWLAALYTMLLMIDTDSVVNRNRNLLLLGCWIGLAIMSKVHGVFLWIGFIGFVVSCRPSWLKNPFLYFSAMITALIISPILLWNSQNNFINWRFHSERVVLTDGINLMSFVSTTFGQIVYNNPVIVILSASALIAIRRHKAFLSLPKLRLLLWCSLPIIATTTIVSLFRLTLPHWSGPGFMGLILLSASYLSYKTESAGPGLSGKLLYASVGLMLFVVVSGVTVIYYYPGPLTSKTEPEIGSGDATLDLFGWEELLPQFRKMRRNDISKGIMSRNAPLLVHKWFPGSHIYYYVAYPLHMNVIGLGTLNDLHKFVWLNKMNSGMRVGSDAYYISPSNNYSDPAEIYAKHFKSIEQAAKIPCYRNGKLARYWYVFRLKGWANDAKRINLETMSETCLRAHRKEGNEEAFPLSKPFYLNILLNY